MLVCWCVWQGVPANAKPPKPPRSKSSRSLSSQASLGSFSLISQVSGALSRSSSILSASSSTNSLAGLIINAGGNTTDGSSSSGSSPGSSSPVGSCFKGSPSRSDLSRRSESGIKLGVTFADEADGASPVRGSSPTGVSGQSPFQSSSAAAAAGGAALGNPELIGFVLLDPLWEEGEEIGYVSSICRMKRNAHQGKE